MFALYRLLLFFFNDTATPEIYTLSLHDALPISRSGLGDRPRHLPRAAPAVQRDTERARRRAAVQDRKSTRLNSSHANISYAVFCLKKKTPTNKINDIISNPTTPRSMESKSQRVT